MNPSASTPTLEATLDLTVDALRAGKTLLYPTDTIWGIGCDARRADAVERLYAIKERDHSKSMLILCAPEQVECGEWRVGSEAWGIESGERPTTFILPSSVWRALLKVPVADNLCAADGSLGIRIPRHAFCQEVIRRLGAPLVSTSANLSGRPSPRCYADIEEALRRRVDFCVPPLPPLLSEETRGSRIVRLNADGSATLLRD